MSQIRRLIPVSAASLGAALLVYGCSDSPGHGANTVLSIPTQVVSAVVVPAPVLGPPPVLTSISTGTGSEGGVLIWIDGTGFTSNVTLTIGGVKAYSGHAYPTTFLTEAPTGVAGPADVVLTNADGQSSTLKDGFTIGLPRRSISTETGKVLRGGCTNSRSPSRFGTTHWSALRAADLRTSCRLQSP